MKNFLIALFVFFVWGGLSIYYLHRSESFKELEYFEQNKAVNGNFSRINDLELDVKYEPISPDNGLYPDNSLLSTEMQNTVTSIRERQESQRSDKPQQNIDNEDIFTGFINGTNGKAVELYPQFAYGELIADRNLTAYFTQVERLIKKYPATEITLIGHYMSDSTTLDNYFEGLKRAKLLKHYITSNFTIPEEGISAISEGSSKPLINTNSPNEKNNRIELIIETHADGR